MAGSDMDVYFQIIGVDKFSSSFKDVEKEMNKIKDKHSKMTDNISSNSKKLQNQNKSLTSSFKLLTGAVATYFTVAFGKQAFSAYAKLDKYIQKIGVVAHFSKKEMEGLQQSILDISSSTGASSTELAQGAQKLVAGGIKDLEQLKKFIESAAVVQKIIPEGTEVKISEIADLMVMIKKNYPNKEADELADTIAYMLDATPGLNFNEFQASLRQSLSVASQLGVSLNELLAIQSGKIVDLGGAQTSTATRNMLLKLKQMNTQIEKSLKVKKIDLGQSEVLKKELNIEVKQGTPIINFLDEIFTKFSDIPPEKRDELLNKLFGAGITTETMISYVNQIEQVKDNFKKLNVEIQDFGKKADARITGSAIDMQNKIAANFEKATIDIGSIIFKSGLTEKFLELSKAIASITGFINKYFTLRSNKQSEAKTKIQGIFAEDLKSGNISTNSLNQSIDFEEKLQTAKAITNKILSTFDNIKNISLPSIGTMTNDIDIQDRIRQSESNTEKKGNIKIILEDKTNAGVKIAKAEEKSSDGFSSIDIKKQDFLNR